MDNNDLIHVAAMVLLFGLYLLDQRRIARRVVDFAAEARRKLRG